MSCDATTTKGQKCKNKTVPYHAYCNTHLTLCRDLLTHYKSVCDMVWSKKCLAQMTTQELTEISEYARECARLRSGFQVECCDQKVDKSHLGAIVKMMNIRKKCNLELERRARLESRQPSDQNSESPEVEVSVTKRLDQTASLTSTKRPVPPLTSVPPLTKRPVPQLTSVFTKRPIPPLTQRSVPPLTSVSTKQSVPPLTSVSTKQSVPPLTSVSTKQSVPPLTSVSTKRSVPPLAPID